MYKTVVYITHIHLQSHLQFILLSGILSFVCCQLLAPPRSDKRSFSLFLCVFIVLLRFIFLSLLFSKQIIIKYHILQGTFQFWFNIFDVQFAPARSYGSFLQFLLSFFFLFHFSYFSLLFLLISIPRQIVKELPYLLALPHHLIHHRS